MTIKQMKEDYRRMRDLSAWSTPSHPAEAEMLNIWHRWQDSGYTLATIYADAKQTAKQMEAVIKERDNHDA